MIKRAVRSKLRLFFILGLIVSMLSGNVTPAFASNNGNQVSTDNSAKTSSRYLTSLRQNLAVMLVSGSAREFVLDRDELTASVQAGKGKTYKTPAYVKEFNDNYENMSLTKAYAQIFRRTQVSWVDADAKASLMLMGPDVFWHDTGPGGGVTYTATGEALSNEYFKQHRMAYDPHGLKGKLYKQHLKTGWYSNWGTKPVGKGVFKERLVDYVGKYFDPNVKTEKPDKYLKDLVKKADDNDKRAAYRIWAYIAAGADAVADGYLDQSPSKRYTEIFEGTDKSKYFDANEVFIGKDGIYELKNGVPQPIDDWDGDVRLRNNVASYLDTLLSLYLVATLNGKSTIAEKYLDAAVGCFVKGDVYVTKPKDLVQTKSIVFDTWSTQCYANVGKYSKGTVVTYTDNWGKYRSVYYASEGKPKHDWRSTNLYYNDYKVTAVAAKSEKLKEWSSQIAESTDRIGLRLSLLYDEDKKMPASVKNLVNSKTIDITYNSLWLPGLAGYGPTSFSLGRYASDTKNDTVITGLKNVKISDYNHYYAGLDTSTTYDLIGGQFVVFMFAQAYNDSVDFVSMHRMSATPNGKKVDPNPNGLNKTITVTYTLGNKVVPASKKTPYNTVGYDKKLLQLTMDWLTNKQKTEGAKLFARTYVTRQITKYRLNTTWVVDSIAKLTSPVKTPGVKVEDAPKSLVGINTTLGYATISKEDFATANKGWTEVKLSDYEALLKDKGCVLIDKYKDKGLLALQWISSPKAEPIVKEVIENGVSKIYTYYPGYDYYLKVSYTADTQFKVAKDAKGAALYTWDYTGAKGKSLEGLSAAEKAKSPVVYSYNVTIGEYAPTTNAATFKYKVQPRREESTSPLVKETLPFAVYSSSPEAYAELKNWGVASTNEPHDGTGLGNGRSPVDTEQGVSATTASNGSSVISEDYEAMAGVPSTEKLYLAIGGSEFIIDIAVQYVPNETAVRSYVVHFDGVPSQYNYASPSGAGGDIPDDSVWGNYPVPQPKGLKSGVTAEVTTSNGGKSINPHNGGTYTLTIRGTIHNDGVDGKKVISDHDGGSYSYPYGNAKGQGDSAFPPRADAAPQGSNGSGSQLTAQEAVAGKTNGLPLVGAWEVTRVPNSSHDSPESWSWAVPRASDVAAFNDCMDDTVKQWIDDMIEYFKNSPGFKAGSDGITRRFGDGKVGTFTYTKDKLLDNIVGYPILTADSGSLIVTPPNDLFRFEGDRVAGESFNIVEFKTNKVYQVTNPANKSAVATSSNNGTLRTISYEIQVKSTGTNYSIKTIPSDDPEGEDTYEQLTSSYSNSNSWSASLTGKWTDGFDVEWFSDTAEGQAEYNAFVAQYNAALAAANAWVAAENAKQASTGAGGLKTGVGDVTASITVNKPVYTSVAFVPDTGSAEAIAKKDKDYDWEASYTFTVQPHTLCGPEDGHMLPEINDVWQQSFNYDYLKIIGLSVLRLDQGAAVDTTDNLTGLNALIGVPKLGVTRQTYYSSPTMNLAQANIFNYMGLQTDGTKDVNTATNEYFRSIAYGLKSDGTPTEWGNTRSAEAKRVQYYMLNADKSELTAKGPTFERLTYKGNTPSSEPFANELLSEWGEGAVNAGDCVVYNFGPRSNLSDGTSRGYHYNIDKSSWIEKVDGVWRGKAAYDLPWAKGFIYDGVQADGTIDASGFSVSRSYRNSSKANNTGGIEQGGVNGGPSTKGWQGKGMTKKTLEYKTEAYKLNADGLLFDVAYYSGSQTKKLYYPAVRDWGATRHLPYSDTRNLLKPEGTTIPGAENGDVAPRKYVAQLWKDNAVKNDDRYAQTQPYDTNNMLDAYTNTASDGGARIRETNEYKLMKAKREELVQATVISDALILDLPNGLQPIMYHYRNAPGLSQAENRIPDTRISFDELWHSNLFTPNGWADSQTGTAQDGIIIGGYNGDLTHERITGEKDVQKRLQWRADEIPVTPTMFIQDKSSEVEDPTGVIGKQLGAKVYNGKNINLFLAHNTDAPTRKLSLPVANKPAVGAPEQRTLLYNITPILLNAENREYETGSAEAFWETIVLWKDSSNHDYYGPYVDGVIVKKPNVYIPDGRFIRLPELLGNYGQIVREVAEDNIEDDDTEDIADPAAALLAPYFIDSTGVEAYGAEAARDAQSEQFKLGFSIAEYNYDTTNTETVNGLYHKNMYNPSPDLTGAAKGNPYIKDGNLGVPFILEGVAEPNFKTDTATRNVGSLRAGLPKSGYIRQTAYNREDVAKDIYTLNNVVVHNPVSARSVQIMPVAAWRDQRVSGQGLVSTLREKYKVGCPEVVELCEFAYLDCKYDKTLELLKLNFIGTGNSVSNTAAHAATTGNIILAGNYAMSSSGLSSNGSPRTGVSLTALGGPYYSSMDYQVTSTITYAANTGEQMLFGFEGYGITLNTATKKLAIRVDGVAGYIDVAGEFNSGDTLKVEFGGSNAALSKVWVNGSLRVLTLAGGATFETMQVAKNHIGDTFYIGSWNSGTPAYLPTASTRYLSLTLERLSGSHQHTLACATTVTHHVGGNNTHVHQVSDLGPSDSNKYLNGTLQAWNNFAIDDATLRERLGDVIYAALGLPKVQTTNIADADVELVSYPVVTNFGTVGTSTYVAPVDGVYKLEAWGAAGGGATPQTVTAYVCNNLPLNTGGYWNNTAATTIDSGDTGVFSATVTWTNNTGSAVTVTAGGDSRDSCGGLGYIYLDGVYRESYTNYGSVQVTVNAGVTIKNTWYSNGENSGHYGGARSYISVPATSVWVPHNAHTHNASCQVTGPIGSTGGLGGYASGYVTLKKGDVLIVNVGGKGTQAPASAGTGAVTNFDYTGSVQTYTAPTTGVYTLEVWGAQGGNLADTGYSPHTGTLYGVGGKGGYSKGQIQLNQGETLYIYVGGKGQGTTGGWNGGGAGSKAGAGGGGATDIRRGGTAYSNRVIVAGGGGGAQYGDGGAGGGLSGEASPRTIAGTPSSSFFGLIGTGGGQTLSTGSGQWGVGQAARTGADNLYGGAGGGGYVGGGSAQSDSSRVDDYGGAGGSGYIGGVIDGTTTAGVRSGHGYATITAPVVLSDNNSGGFNGGGKGGPGGFGGGGATDFRLNGTALSNRILVAGGGGGADNADGGLAGQNDDGSGGAGGGLVGGNAYIDGVQVNPNAVQTVKYTDVSPNNVKGFYNYASGLNVVPFLNGGIDASRYANPIPVEFRFTTAFITGYVTLSDVKFHVIHEGGSGYYTIKQLKDMGIITNYTYRYTDENYPLNGIGNIETGGSASGSYFNAYFQFDLVKGKMSGVQFNSSKAAQVYANDGKVHDGISITAKLSGSYSGTGGTQTKGYALGVGESATALVDTGGGGGGYYGGFATNDKNGGGGGGSSYTGGVTNGNTQSGVRSGNGYATITAPSSSPTKSYTFTVTGSPKKFEATAVRLSGTGNIKISLYSGTTADANKLIGSVTGNPNAVYPSLDSPEVVLSAGTYTVVVSSTDTSSLTLHFTAKLYGRNLQYSDIMSLPNIDGAEAWRQIPYYLPNGNRNPVYSCNNEFNAHVCSPVKSQEFSYTGDVQTFIAPITGTYTFEVWGAQGGDINNFKGGLGGYSKGTYYLTAGQMVSIYVGGAGGVGAGGWNGGGASDSPYGRSGGGATDIRVGGTSLSNRVIVAGGGGGANNRNMTEPYGQWPYGDGDGGAGGGLTGGTGQTINHTRASDGYTYGWGYGTGGTQTSGGNYVKLDSNGVVTLTTVSGSLGQGGIGQSGGGGGYYGGASAAHGGAGGGSGYIGGVSDGIMKSGIHSGDGKAVITWTDTSLCFTETTYDNCSEPHHRNNHYEGDSLCYTACFDDTRHDTNFVRNTKVNSYAAEFVSIDWDYTLYADTLDNFRTGVAYQLEDTISTTGLGYYDTNVNGEFDTIRFTRAKYVKFPWIVLYDGVLYNPGEWIVLGDRGDYAKGKVSVANNSTGFGGNVQSGVNGVNDIWDGKQAAEYNVQNWSAYNQQSYKDLYKDFYDFYVPLSNSEMSLGEVTYATVAVNASDDREPVYQPGLPAVLSATARINDWLDGNFVNNRNRDMNMAAVGAGKVFYVDVVGRVGGLVIEDTTDVKFSNTFKQPLAPVAESKTTYDIDLTDLSGVKAGRTTKALQLSNSIINGGKLLNATSTLPTRALLTEVSDWVGFVYAGDNARKFVITVEGDKLKAGELTVDVTDAANGDYTLRLSDMIVTSNTDQLLSVEVNVKQTNAAVTIKPKFALIDTSVAGVYVSKMTVAVGGSGFGQGLNKIVDETKQNFYVTDITDVRGVYLGPALNTGSAVEGRGTLAYSRYDTFRTFGDWIRMSDATQVRDAQHISQRTTPVYGTRAINTYGTRPWVQLNDPLYKALASAGGKALIGPLTSSYNAVSQYRTAEDQLSIGAKVFYDITTIGSYADMDATMKIIPSYYLVDTTKKDATGAVALIPVDVYQFSSAGNYQPVNIFGAPYGGFTDTQIDAFNQYRLSINWNEEAVGPNNRRMVTNEEYQAARTYSELFSEDVYEGNPYNTPGLDLDDPSTYPTPIGQTPSLRQLPSGIMQIGGSQFIQQGYQTQTYIGSHRTYGVDKSGGLFAPFESDPTQSAKYIYWQVGAQRWHTTLGLPSDAVFVPLAQDPVTNKFVHRAVSEIPTHAVDIKENLIICYIDVYVEGSVWTLHYGNQGVQRTININGVDYALPIMGPAGPAMANPYPGQSGVGSDYTNGGIPFVVFGGSRVQGQADIIKVN